MGAGTGKTRRIRVTGQRAQAPTLKGVRVFRKAMKWSKWAREQNLHNVTIGDYYLGSSVPKLAKDLSNKEMAFLLHEFFLDAVQVGVITFSNPTIKPESFRVHVQKKASNMYRMTWEYAPQNKVVTSGTSDFYGFYLEPEKKLRSLRDISYYIVHALQEAAK